MGDFTFSEHGEDILVHRLLHWKNCGYYIDVGAYHPRKMSLTARLRNFGWHGLNIDADPRVYDCFNREVSWGTNINCAVIDKDREGILLYRYEDAVINTINEAQLGHLTAIENRGELHTKTLDAIRVNGHSFATLMKRHNVEAVDFLNLDIEGAELEALHGFPWELCQPRVIACELHRLDLANIMAEPIVSFLYEKGYVLQSYVFHTTIFVPRSFDVETCHRFPFERL